MLGQAMAKRMAANLQGFPEKRQKTESGSNAWWHAINGDAGDMCNGRETHHRGTWVLGLKTAEGEQEITLNYKYKADIIVTTLWSMAIKLETRKGARKAEGTAHWRAGDTTWHGQQQSQPCLLMVGLQFKEPLLYGSQGEHGNFLMPTLLATSQHGPGWGS
jgi:hypothetical protein